MSGIECLAPERLGPILERIRNPDASRSLPRFPLDTLLITILEKANEFVPSAAGSILLDDPLLKLDDASAHKDLIFVCCFGPSAGAFLGKRIPIETGIAGAVYRTGISRITNDAYLSGGDFADEFDRQSGYLTRSVLCVAIRIGQSICGVIELVNRQGLEGYTEAEKELLGIFAQYISSTIQNALDAKRIGKLVRTDDLTGLHNDRYLYERLPLEVERSLTSCAPLSMLFLDLDRFKEINDTHGHLAGSATLAEFGRLLRQVVGREDATLVRYGGDEFVVLLPGTDTPAALSLAQSVCNRTERHVFLDARWGEEEPLHLSGIITASIGVATLSTPETATLAAKPLARVGMNLLQTADHAMYTSKSRGKNVVTAEPFAFPQP